MIKCIECGKTIKDGGPRYATPDGSYCRECWHAKDQKFKDDMLKRVLYGAAVRGARFSKAVLDVKKGGKR